MKRRVSFIGALLGALLQAMPAGADADVSVADRALILRDQGRHEEASAEWLKATKLESADGFIWNQRGWAELATGRRREAREAFTHALERASTTATQAEANVGLGLSFIFDGKRKAADTALRQAGLSGPYAISLSAQLIAEAALSRGDPQTALTYLRQAVEIDPANNEALNALAHALAEARDKYAAWRAYRKIVSLDPKNVDARKRYEKLGRSITGDLDAAAGVRRIARPALDFERSAETALSSTSSIRVGLYGGPEGRPAILKRAHIMANSVFKVTSVFNGARRDNGRPFDAWEIYFRTESGLVEVRDAALNIIFTSTVPFTFEADSTNGSILIKNAEIDDPIGIDPGDREVRSAVSVVPAAGGFRLVQVAAVEQYLIGVVSLALPIDSPPEALRAQAVVARTEAYFAIGNRDKTVELWDILDDDSTQRTIGVSGELRSAAEAVADTVGLALCLQGRSIRVLQHEDSGGVTEAGAETGARGLDHLVSVQDSAASSVLWRTPVELERYTHEVPPQGLFSEAAASATPNSTRWVYLLDARDLRQRISRRKDIGAILHLRIAGRTPTGRVRALEVIGAGGTARYTGNQEIAELLAPSSLRSTLFTIQPLMEGRRVARIILWGVGTGSGVGFSRMGAVGQARLGASWRDILRRYFPRLEVKG